jgi:catechol 2,3-dioxygenase-like lactoylglutathione lyase family enzyme
VITIQDVVYARFQVPDLDAADEFMRDFGLLSSARTDGALYLRGYGSNHHIYVAERGPEARCVGFGLAAKSHDDLERLAAATGAAVERTNEPGGGSRVALIDPTGFRVEVVHGVEPLPSVPTRPVQALNLGGQRLRLNETVRPEHGPSHVMRLGHVALVVSNLDASIDFYGKLLGMKIADTYYIGDEANRMAAFMRCGRGADYTDHHSVAMVQPPQAPPRPTFDHISFEVLDWDDIMLGHDHMRRTGKYRHSWGVGRHIDGSNLFDYWRDPFGAKIEHYSDGDIINDGYAASHSRFDPSDPGKQLSVWGPPITSEFFS